MANVSGSVLYDPLRQANDGTAITQVPVALYHQESGMGVVALSDSTGAFLFTGVPDGSYRLIEAWGQPGETSPVDWSQAAAMDCPDPADPPVGAVEMAAGWANRLDSLTPNTRILSVEGGDLAGQNFYDGPTEDRPLSLVWGPLCGANLITDGDGGQFGACPDGTSAGFVQPSNPYPKALRGLSYSTVLPPESGSASLSNIVTGVPGWWGTANHTTGCENGRMLVLHQVEPGTVFFQQTLSVLPKSSYVLSAWVTGLLQDGQIQAPDVQIRAKVTAPDGTPLLDYGFGAVPAADLSQWTQVGAVFDSQSYMTLYLELSAEGESPLQNTFAVDDISLTPVVEEKQLSVVQEADRQEIDVGDTVEYTVAVQNTSPFVLEQVAFQGEVPNGLQFVPGSLTVNGSDQGLEAAQLGEPVELGLLPPGASKIIRYEAQVQSLSGGQIQQSAGSVSYLFLKSAVGDLFFQTVESNPVCFNQPSRLREQALTEVVKAMAVEQTALSNLLKAEGSKWKAMMRLSSQTPEELLALNSGMLDTVQSLSQLQSILHENMMDRRERTVDEIQ